MDCPLWDNIKAVGSSRITQDDVKKGRKALRDLQVKWNNTHGRGMQIPWNWNYLSRSVRICQILLRSGVDTSAFNHIDGSISDELLPLSDDTVSTLIPDNPEAQSIFKEEQVRCFGTFLFDGNETRFEDNEFLPFQDGHGKLGEGSFSIVEKVKYVHTRDSREPVIFARKRPKALRDETIKALENEMRILRTLGKHHHIVEFVGSYKHKHDMGIILYPAANNGNLEQYLRNGDNADHMLLRRVFGCLSIGLSFLNNACRLRHKDIKASNILIHGSDVLFTDFGSAFQFTDNYGKTENKSAGQITRRYAAPEIISSSERNIKTDLFALGCIFAEVLTHLAGSSVQELHRHMRAGQQGKTDILYGENTPRLRKWLQGLCEGDPDLKIPLDWCLQMIEDMEKRPHIVDLVENMKKRCEANNELDTFFCSNCLEEFADNKSRSAKLTRAVQKESSIEAKQLVEEGVDVEARDRYGLTPLSHAVRNGNMAVVEFLLERRADVTAKEPTEDFTPLHWAVKTRRTTILKRLLHWNIDAKTKNEALRLAALNGDTDMVECLLNSGARVSDESMFGRGVLHQAAQSKSPEVVRLLIKHGADVSATDMQGHTPLHLAAASGHEAIVKLLLDEMTAKSFDVDVTDNTGRTPLHLAAFHGHIGAVKLLVDQGALINRPDNRGLTSVSLASCSDNETVEQFLCDQGQQQAEKESELVYRQKSASQDGSAQQKKKITWAVNLRPPAESSDS